MLDTTCPECGAPHARKLSTIHAEGFSTVQTDINTVGTFNTIGRQKIKTQGTSTATQQTQASKDAAPPEVPEFEGKAKAAGGLIFIVGLIALLLGILSTTWVVAAVAVALIGVGAVMVSLAPSPEEIQRYEEETRELREAAALWPKTFQCGACSHRFVPTEVQVV